MGLRCFIVLELVLVERFSLIASFLRLWATTVEICDSCNQNLCIPEPSSLKSDARRWVEVTEIDKNAINIMNEKN